VSTPNRIDPAHIGLPDLRILKTEISSVPAVPKTRAAAELGVSLSSIYRLVKKGRLEALPRGTKNWISVRSLLNFVQRRYHASDGFDLLSGRRRKQRHG
jgi:Helix-turn-helix domain